MSPLVLMRLRIWPVEVVERLRAYGVEVWKWQVFNAMSRLTTP